MEERCSERECSKEGAQKRVSECCESKLSSPKSDAARLVCRSATRQSSGWRPTQVASVRWMQRAAWCVVAEAEEWSDARSGVVRCGGSISELRLSSVPLDCSATALLMLFRLSLRTACLSSVTRT